MIRKSELVKKIGTIIELEKSLIPLLNRHLTSTLFFSSLKAEERSAIIERFKKAAITQSKHINTLNDILEEAKKGKNDVY